MIAKVPARQRILDAAITLMWRNGYDGVSVDAICDAANVRKGSFYHAFASKEALLNAAIKRVWEHDRAEIECCYADNSPPLLQFRNHLEWFGLTQRRLRAQFGFVPGMFNMAAAMNAPQEAREISARASQEHGAILGQGVNAALAARQLSPAEVQWWSALVTQLINGAVIQARLSNSLAPFDTFPESVLALMGLGRAPFDPP